MNERLRALTVLAAVFLLGCLVSGGLFYAWSSRFLARESGPFVGPPSPQNWTAALKLSPGQETRFRDVMNESRLKIDAVMEENAPKMEAIRAEMNRKLITILDRWSEKGVPVPGAAIRRTHSLLEERPPPQSSSLLTGQTGHCRDAELVISKTRPHRCIRSGWPAVRPPPGRARGPGAPRPGRRISRVSRFPVCAIHLVRAVRSNSA